MEVFVRYNKYWQEGMEMEDSNMSQKMELYYDRPASVWEETIPIGNGRMGGMIWGYRGRRFRGRVLCGGDGWEDNGLFALYFQLGNIAWLQIGYRNFESTEKIDDFRKKQ